MKSKKIVMIVIAFLLGFLFLQALSNEVEAADAEGNFVIVLDPGHGDYDSGAIGGGIKEADVNFKIAYYAKEELEQYEGVKVYLTRYNDCPSIYDRVEIAKRYNADLLVSMHINSGASTARGAAIWVTQDNTQIEYYQKAAEASWQILNRLSGLGIQNNGVQTRSGSSNEWYDSGVVQDYYGIIRYAQRVKMRSILIEHCFISNAQDRQFINSDDKIRRIAQADVQGIADAYQLRKKGQGFVPLKSIKLKQTEVNMEITNENPNPSYFMPVTYMPSNTSNKTIYWYTSNSSVATVNAGTIFAKGQGEATITAISGNNQRLATCKVIVSKPKVPLTGIKLKQDLVTVEIGKTGFIGAIYEPSNADDKVLYWISSNEQVAKVHEGIITPVARGTATLTAISRAGGKTASCQVKVEDSNFIELEEITMKKEKLELKQGEIGWLGVTYVPSNANDKVLTWTSSNPSVATVSEGNVRAVGKGTAILTATSRDGNKTATCEVTVTDGTVALDSISLKTTKLEMKKGEKTTIYVTYNPSDVTNKVLKWTSSNPSVATVSEGNVTAVGKGAATITAKSEDGGKTATCQVTVTDGTVALQSISLKTTKLEMKKGEKTTIYATYNPTNATNKVLTWTSSNSSVASVSEGNVTAVGNGTATITAKAADGGKTAACQVTVIDGTVALQSLSLKSNMEILTKGNRKTIYAVYNPSNVTDKVLYWTSSNPNVATISEGNVTAVGNGVTTITAKSRDGGKIATCQIIVVNPNTSIKEITLKTTEVTMKKGESQIIYATYNPTNVSDKTIYWISSNPSVATVSEGNVRAVGKGTATITAITQDGGKIATCMVNITN